MMPDTEPAISYEKPGDVIKIVLLATFPALGPGCLLIRPSPRWSQTSSISAGLLARPSRIMRDTGFYIPDGRVPRRPPECPHSPPRDKMETSANSRRLR